MATILSVSVPVELRAALDAEAKRQRRSRSFVVSEAIRAYVASREREAFAAGRDETLREALALSPAARLREAEELWQEFARTHEPGQPWTDRKSTRLNSSHGSISYAVFCLKKK